MNECLIEQNAMLNGITKTYFSGERNRCQSYVILVFLAIFP